MSTAKLLKLNACLVSLTFEGAVVVTATHYFRLPDTQNNHVSLLLCSLHKSCHKLHHGSYQSGNSRKAGDELVDNMHRRPKLNLAR